MVYDQWLHADLREVASQTCMPARVVEQQACQISGTFVVQVCGLGSPGVERMEEGRVAKVETLVESEEGRAEERNRGRYM